MARLRFLGASSGIVTGSSYLLTSSKGRSVLVDLGMFQGPREINRYNQDPLGFNSASLESVVLTHAHLDHCGRLPLLVRNGFRGKIYMTKATRELTEIVLFDSAKIAENDRREEALYTAEDVERLLGKIEVVEYHAPFEIGGLSAEVYDAGHILGSASIVFSEEGRGGKRKYVFSGDLGNSPEDIAKPTEYIDSGDVVVMESTYGNRVHPKEDADEILAREINQIERSGGALLIPAFSIERTQVLLHMIDHLKKESKVRSETRVYLDSPMSIKTTMAYERNPELYNQEILAHSRKDDPFDFPGLSFVEDSRDSKRIKRYKGPKIIIAGSGMMAGGRILAHAIDFLPLSSTRLLFVGFQAKGTVGREILDGARSVRIYGRHIQVNASLSEINSLSAHADQPRLLVWLRNIKGAKKVFLIHGEDEAREILSAKIKSEILIQKVILPEMNQEIEI